ncbi:hypothetical protein DRO32_04475 [Candidatus Bathyarchaeota archaeon]|nr:MAG: hypothetical protein DRO32_04475 [Candidatus Bathyarchaeota archaeon]
MRARGKGTLRVLMISLLLGLAVGFLLGYEVGKRISPAGGSLEIIMVYGSEKREWIEAVVPEFERWYEERYHRAVRVICIPMGSGKSMSQILLGQIKPVVWSPASSVWIPLMNYLWEQDHPDLVRERGPIVTDWEPLVSSPIVIITWGELQATWNITGFRKLYELVEAGADVKFSHTDPFLSNSGLMAVLLELVAATGKEPPELTVEDMMDEEVRAFIRAIEARAVDYMSSTGFMVDSMVSEGPGKKNVVVAYENLVILYNRIGTRWGRLVAVYPEEGILMSDHPFCVLNAPWVSREQEEVARALLRFLLRADIQARAMRYGFRPENDTVELDPSVFGPAMGVELDLSAYGELSVGGMRGEVALFLPDLWLACRP